MWIDLRSKQTNQWNPDFAQVETITMGSRSVCAVQIDKPYTYHNTRFLYRVKVGDTEIGKENRSSIDTV